MEQARDRHQEVVVRVPEAVSWLLAWIFFAKKIADPAGKFINAQVVLKPGVGGAGEDEGSWAQLLDPPHALEFFRADDV